MYVRPTISRLYCTHTPTRCTTWWYGCLHSPGVSWATTCHEKPHSSCPGHGVRKAGCSCGWPWIIVGMWGGLLCERQLSSEEGHAAWPVWLTSVARKLVCIINHIPVASCRVFIQRTARGNLIPASGLTWTSLPARQEVGVNQVLGWNHWHMFCYMCLSDSHGIWCSFFSGPSCSRSKSKRWVTCCFSFSTIVQSGKIIPLYLLLLILCKP